MKGKNRLHPSEMSDHPVHQHCRKFTVQRRSWDHWYGSLSRQRQNWRFISLLSIKRRSSLSKSLCRPDSRHLSIRRRYGVTQLHLWAARMNWPSTHSSLLM